MSYEEKVAVSHIPDVIKTRATKVCYVLRVV